MKESYNIKSDRYNHIHHFIKKFDKNDEYLFIPAEDWMPIYVTMNEDNKSVKFIDTEGGPCLGIGWKNDEIEVIDIFKRCPNETIFKLKEI